jgi:hypothetical protein
MSRFVGATKSTYCTCALYIQVICCFTLFFCALSTLASKNAEIQEAVVKQKLRDEELEREAAAVASQQKAAAARAAAQKAQSAAAAAAAAAAQQQGHEQQLEQQFMRPPALQRGGPGGWGVSSCAQVRFAWQRCLVEPASDLLSIASGTLP